MHKEKRALLSISDFTGEYPPCRTNTYKLINSGQLAAVKIGRRTFITRDSAEAWARSLPAYVPGSQSK